MISRRNSLCVGLLRSSFTLVELLISISIIAVLAASSLFALYGVEEHARESRTRSQIARLNEIIMEKLESYRTRTIPISVPNGITVQVAPVAWLKMVATRELMRMEMPERITDLADPSTAIVFTANNAPVFSPAPMSPPSLWRSYRRIAGFIANGPPPPTWTPEKQFSECLYLIVAETRTADYNALDFFNESEIGDLDGDGMREILDGWGRPIAFMRWAPGFTYYWGLDNAWGIAGQDDDSLNGMDDIGERATPGSDDERISDVQDPDGRVAPDPFDPLRVDFRFRDAIATNDPFALVPLIVSAGPDGVLDLWDADLGFRHYAIDNTPPPANTPVICTFDLVTLNQSFNNDPYQRFVVSGGVRSHQIGMPIDNSGPLGTGPDGVPGWADNITNHLISTR